MGYQKENERLVSELKDSKKLAKVLREQLSSRSSNMLSSSSRDEAYDKKIVAQNLRKQLDLESQIESMRQKLVYEKRENVRVLHTDLNNSRTPTPTTDTIQKRTSRENTKRDRSTKTHGGGICGNRS